MSRRYDTVSFLSDYGTADEFVGVVKAVIRDLAPHVSVIDITHEVPPFDVRAGSVALARSIAYLPAGVVLAVVDPGVGTDRRAVAVEVAGGNGVVIGPDNGLIASAVALAGGAERAVVLDNVSLHLEAPGATFAGRDVFAPVVAHLCNGVPFEELGSPIDAELLLPGVVPVAREENGGLSAEVTWVDRYGNCQLNVGPDDVAGWGTRIRVSIDGMGRSAPVVSSFAEAGSGIALVVDSYGMLALCVDRQSAALELGLTAGSAVFLSSLDGDDGGVSTQVSLSPRR
ncbi:MAG: S-adenosyl-l-methionine hydroxide adenosyltransferase family protein [Ilumatobacteraceae bacterium]